MPTYDYKCGNCGHLFEIVQSMKDEKLTKCPDCNHETLQRLIGAGGGLIFKGSGFYLTDYKNKSSEATSPSNNIAQKENSKAGTGTEAKQSESNSTKESNNTSEAKSDTRTEAKTAKDSSKKSDKKNSESKKPE